MVPMPSDSGRPAEHIIELRDLVIAHATSGRRIVDRVSLNVQPGQAFGLVGESGSGKTTTALALLGWVRPGLRLLEGTSRIGGQQLLGRGEKELRALRKHAVAFVPQNASTALNPSLRVGKQIAEVLRDLPSAEQTERVRESLELVGLPADEQFRRRFPHQLSGGQQQRLALSVALARRPLALVLDEPTTGLDRITQRDVLNQIDRIRRELGIATISISHDLALISARTDAVAVMLNGRIIESGPTREILSRPRQQYTKVLVRAAPSEIDEATFRSSASNIDLDTHADDASSTAILSVSQLNAAHRTARGKVVVAHDISFELQQRSCLALVGESGSGKTTIGRCVAGLHIPERGTIRLNGEVLAPAAGRRTLEQRRALQIIFQDPGDSLNPRQSVQEAITRPLRYLMQLDRKGAERRMGELLELVRFPARLAEAHPAELSGGECQRVAIARALAPEPAILVCDEITSSLDASIQASVLELIEGLRRDLGLSLIFISHDLGIVASLADEVMVIERGAVCEHSAASDVFLKPAHPYTRALLSASPTLPSGSSPR